MNNHLVEMVLTCGSWQEAQRVADALLEKRLVSSVETFEIKPTHWWDNHTHGTQEVKLVVLGLPENAEPIRNLTDQVCHIRTASISLTD